jgi:hypothetical protein
MASPRSRQYPTQIAPVHGLVQCGATTSQGKQVLVFTDRPPCLLNVPQQTPDLPHGGSAPAASPPPPAPAPPPRSCWPPLPCPAPLSHPPPTRASGGTGNRRPAAPGPGPGSEPERRPVGSEALLVPIHLTVEMAEPSLFGQHTPVGYFALPHAHLHREDSPASRQRGFYFMGHRPLAYTWLNPHSRNHPPAHGSPAGRPPLGWS